MARLFKDGVHSIYAYLTSREWKAAFSTCHLWHTAAATAPTLHFTFTLPCTGTILCTPPNHLIHHFTRVNQPQYQSGLVVLTRSQMTQVFLAFPSLTHLKCQMSITKDVPSNELHQPYINLPWPNNFKHLDLQLLRHQHPGFISDIFQVNTLETLELLYTGDDWTPFYKLRDLKHLTHLRLRFNQDAPVDIIKLAKIDYLPLTLTTLDLPSDHCFNSLVRLELHFPHLTQFSCHFNLQLGDLKKIYWIGPNLSTLGPERFCWDDFGQVSVFTNLTQIIFSDCYGFQSEFDPEDIIISGLSGCPQLTDIQFLEWTPSKKSSYVRLSESCPKLRFLHCHWLGRKDQNLTLDVLLPFKRLEILKFDESKNSFSERFQDDVRQIARFFHMNDGQLKFLTTVYIDIGLDLVLHLPFSQFTMLSYSVNPTPATLLLELARSQQPLGKTSLAS